MLATLIQRYDKNHFISRTRDKLKFYRLWGATFYDCINNIHQFIKPFLDYKMSIFEEYGAVNIQRALLSNLVQITSAIKGCNLRISYFETYIAVAMAINIWGPITQGTSLPIHVKWMHMSFNHLAIRNLCGPFSCYDHQTKQLHVNSVLFVQALPMLITDKCSLEELLSFMHFLF